MCLLGVQYWPQSDVWSARSNIRYPSIRPPSSRPTHLVCLLKLPGNAHRFRKEMLWTTSRFMHLNAATHGPIYFVGGGSSPCQKNLERYPGRGRCSRSRREQPSVPLCSIQTVCCVAVWRTWTWSACCHTQLLRLEDSAVFSRSTWAI